MGVVTRSRSQWSLPKKITAAEGVFSDSLDKTIYVQMEPGATADNWYALEEITLPQIRRRRKKKAKTTTNRTKAMADRKMVGNWRVTKHDLIEFLSNHSQKANKQ